MPMMVTPDMLRKQSGEMKRGRSSITTAPPPPPPPMGKFSQWAALRKRRPDMIKQLLEDGWTVVVEPKEKPARKIKTLNEGGGGLAQVAAQAQRQRELEKREEWMRQREIQSKTAVEQAIAVLKDMMFIAFVMFLHNTRQKAIRGVVEPL